MSEELKPCLRCGTTSEDDVLLEFQHDEDGEHTIGCWLVCQCGLSIWAPTIAEVYETWNERPLENDLTARVAELEAQLAAAQAELNRVAPFLAIHGIAGYSMTTTISFNEKT